MMNARSLTYMFAGFGALANFLLVLVGADHGALSGTSILIGLFIGGICAAPFALPWFFPTKTPPNSVAAIFMLLATLAAVAFSLFIFWTFLSANGADRDPLIIVVVPIYVGSGLGIAAAVSQFIARF